MFELQAGPTTCEPQSNDWNNNNIMFILALIILRGFLRVCIYRPYMCVVVHLHAHAVHRQMPLERINSTVCKTKVGTYRNHVPTEMQPLAASINAEGCWKGKTVEFQCSTQQGHLQTATSDIFLSPLLSLCAPFQPSSSCHPIVAVFCPCWCCCWCSAC